MSETGSLTSLFASKGQTAPDAVVAQAHSENQEQPSTQAAPSDDDGQEDMVDQLSGGGLAEATESPKTQQLTDESKRKRVPLPKLLEEREARHAAEKKLIEYETRLRMMEEQRQAAMQAQQVPQAEDFDLSDDDIFDAQKMRGKLAAYRGSLANELRQTLMQQSVAMAMHTFPDYQEVVGKWEEAVRENPAIAVAVQSSPAPAFDAYKQVKAHIAAKNALNPDEVNKKIEAEVARRLEEEKAKLGLSQVKALPTTLSGARGTGGNRSVPTPPVAPANVRNLPFPIRGR